MPTDSPTDEHDYRWQVRWGDWDQWVWGTFEEYLRACYPCYAKINEQCPQTFKNWNDVTAYIRVHGEPKHLI